MPVSFKRFCFIAIQFLCQEINSFGYYNDRRIKTRKNWVPASSDERPRNDL